MNQKQYMQKRIANQRRELRKINEVILDWMNIASLHRKECLKLKKDIKNMKVVLSVNGIKDATS